MSNRRYNVLIVDDSSDDRFFLRMLLAKRPQFSVVGEVRDGQEAIDWLSRAPNAADVMFLDLKMPVKDGFDVLHWMQTQNAPKMIVVIMSGSRLPEDITKAISLGAHAYFKKSSLKEEQQKMISDLESLLGGMDEI